MRSWRHAALALGLLAAAASRAAAPEACPAPGDGRDRTYRNERYGVLMRYPSVFALDADSIPALGDSARFWTADRRATAVVNAARTSGTQSLDRLLAEAEEDILRNSHGEITYRRRRDNWFVFSGYILGRIFYRRSFLAPDGTVATLWMEFPRALRPCLEAAVTTMSLSFRPM
ncbi:hypothetical protein [Paracraurococcus lichenis]|uniref:Uncharacterized protein n=1 Tax=Paracraurococcus lichenis TaxID=3064888 RepID=A0ABT9E481_9PROT|nr:hypothetical protein [Paracraurococcus sp. LOR1-02]MDO9710962.1 hypothetical protein [Paracraurococcus sp. LOR1-02]